MPLNVNVPAISAEWPKSIPSSESRKQRFMSPSDLADLRIAVEVATGTPRKGGVFLWRIEPWPSTCHPIDMETVASVFRSRDDAQRAAREVHHVRLDGDRVSLLLPGASESEIH